jgi:hypothetical protein
MRSRLSIASVLVLFVALCGWLGSAQAQQQTDAQIRQAIIKDSIAGYSGSCPCPYNKAKNGSNCGGRSAYSRRGGAPPFCYAKDVTDAMVADWRQSRR